MPDHVVTLDSQRDNVNVHRAAAKIMQAGKAARPAAPCATYCYPAICGEIVQTVRVDEPLSEHSVAIY